MRKETEFKRHFRKELMVWSGTVEPARFGSDVGFPDLVVLRPCGLLLPVEVKDGTIADGRVFTKEIRPAQIQWMDKFQRSGGRVRLVIGVRLPSGWFAWGKRDCSLWSLGEWKRGWERDNLDHIMSNGELNCEAWEAFAS